MWSVAVNESLNWLLVKGTLFSLSSQGGVKRLNSSFYGNRSADT
jgi:hypothetical protein